MIDPVFRFDRSAISEDERLRALASYGAMEESPDAVLDSLVRLAARLCDAPIGMVTLVDEARQLFKARTGSAGPSTAPLDVGFCPVVVAQREPVIIRDTLADAAHSDNVSVREDGVRFYAGVPLLGDEKHVLGTLCVLDIVPRPAGLTPAQIDVLQTLSTQIVSQFELRRSLAQRDALLDEQRASIRERDALAKVQAAIAAADGDLDTILAALVSNTMDAVPAAEGGVLELIEDDALEYRAVLGALTPHRGLRVPLRGSLAGSCAVTNAPILVDDVLKDDRVVRELVERLNLRAAVLAPVARGGQVLGVLKLQSSRPAAFGPRDLQVVHLFAGVATAGLTEVRAAETQRAVLAGARRQRAIFDSAVDFAIVATDLDGRVTDWNAGAERVLGWTPDEMRGDTVERIFTPEDRKADRAGTEMSLALQYGRASDERWHVRRDGSRFWASGEMTPLRDGRDAPIGFLKILRDRTAEHEAGKALREAEADLQRAQLAGGVGVFTIAVTDDTLRTTPGFCRIFGLPMSERIRPEDVERLVLPEDVHLTSNAAKRAAGEVLTDVEFRIRRADTGAIRWLSRRSEIERDEAGTPVRLFGVVRDVTEQRLATDALARSEALARENVQRVQLALAAGAIIGTWFWDVTTDRFAVDEAFAIAFGIDPALGRVGLSLEQVIATVHPDDKQGLAQAIEEAVIRGGPYAHQYRVRRADGLYHWIEANGRVEHAADGTPLSFPGVLMNVEARRAAEAERDRAAAALRDLAETLEQRVEERTRELHDARDFTRLALSSVGGVGAWTYDVASDKFFCSPAIADLYGLDPVQAERGIGRVAFTANVHPNDKAALAATMAGGLEKPGDLELEYRIRHPDGSIRWVLSRGHTYQEDGRPTRRVGIGVETTKRHQLEEQLRQSQKMEAVGQLTGGLAHDFNNLLTGVTGSLELLQTRIAQGRIKDVDRYVNAAQGAAKRAAALTHRLLAFSRRQTLDPKPTDVNRLIGGMEEMIRRTVGPEIIVEPMVGAAGIWTTLIDPGQLENALLNLCINARDAMPDGGKLTIETGNRWLDERTAKDRDLSPGQYVSLCVSDTGTGMPPDVAAKAFDPFFTTKPIGMGTGLGLSMIYGFAQQSGGQVRIYSEVGQGTTVCLYLPRHLGEADGVQVPPELADAPRAEEGQTVLVVDDEPTVRMLVTEVLEDLGYRAIEAADGAAGLQVLQSDVRVDLLVTDVGLPGGMNGRQVADAARVARPGLKVLFITGYAENAVLSHGHLDPGMHVLTKPFAMEALASRIKDLIAGA